MSALVAFAGVSVQGAQSETISLESAPRTDQASEVLARLVEFEADPSRAKDLAASLYESSGPSVDALFSVLRLGEVPAGEPYQRRVPTSFTAFQEGALLEALERFPREQLIPFLERETLTSRSTDTIATAILVLGRIGTGSDLKLAVRIATPDGEEERVDRRVRSGLQAAAEVILKRDKRAFGVIRSHFNETHEDLRALLVRAVGAVPRVEGLSVLSSLLWNDPGYDPLILAQMGRIADVVPHPIDESILFSVRSYASFGQPDARRQAVLTIGRLEDSESVPDLVNQLSSDDAGLRGNCFWALRRITRLNMRDEPSRWVLWHEEEQRWWRERSATVFQRLDSTRYEMITASINDIASHRTFRHDLARKLLPVLRREGPEIQRLTCSALAQLGSPVALEDLIMQLRSGEDSVRREAWRALKAITGKDLPMVTEEWEEWEEWAPPGS